MLRQKVDHALLAKRLLAPLKLCNNHQKCFEHGEQWGHFQYIMCTYLGEDEHGCYCGLDRAYVREDD